MPDAPRPRPRRSCSQHAWRVHGFGHVFSVPKARRREETLFFFIPSTVREESLFVSISIARAKNPYSKWFLKDRRYDLIGGGSGVFSK
jgi:hypothetical protein